jgi:hypothetical protein
MDAGVKVNPELDIVQVVQNAAVPIKDKIETNNILFIFKYFKFLILEI